LPLSSAPDGVRIAIRLTPRGRADRVDGIAASADGRSVLKIAVTAPPAENRANAALIDLLAKEWRLPKRDIAIVGGAKSRDKAVHIAGEPAALLKRIAPLLAGLPRS
jgi:uncharacterized protein (TIGR00251 family)